MGGVTLPFYQSITSKASPLSVHVGEKVGEIQYFRLKLDEILQINL